MCRQRNFCCEISKSRCNTSGRIYGRCWGFGPTDIWLYQQRAEAGFAGKGITLFFFFYKNVVFPAQAEYSYFSADFRLKIFLYYS